MTNIEKEVRRLRNLTQNKNKNEEELIIIAKESLERQEILGSLTFCLDSEKKFATELLNKYLEESSLESTSEKDTLKHLIDLEVLLERIKTQLNSEYGKANPTIPIAFIQQVTELTNQIMDLKDKLGLSKQKEQQTVLDEWNKLKAKALAYYKESAGCNICRCPECKKLFYILKDMRGHTTEKAPIFKKTVLYSREMYSWLEKGLITKEQLAKALGISIDGIIYIYENIYKNDTSERVIE
jgi:uncharacterized C2H2 Zn-finger protein